MRQATTALLSEPDVAEPASPLPYPGMLKDLARRALERRPLYDYRGRSARAVRERIAEVRRVVRRCLGLRAREIPARPTRVRELRRVQFDGFSITPVAIQRGNGWCITAHLYVPDGSVSPRPP